MGESKRLVRWERGWRSERMRGSACGEWESDWVAGQAHPVRGSQKTKKGRVRMTHDPAPKGGTTVSALRGDAVTHGPLYGR